MGTQQPPNPFDDSYVYAKHLVRMLQLSAALALQGESTTIVDNRGKPLSPDDARRTLLDIIRKDPDAFRDRVRGEEFSERHEISKTILHELSIMEVSPDERMDRLLLVLKDAARSRYSPETIWQTVMTASAAVAAHKQARPLKRDDPRRLASTLGGSDVATLPRIYDALFVAIGESPQAVLEGLSGSKPGHTGAIATIILDAPRALERLNEIGSQSLIRGLEAARDANPVLNTGLL